VSDNQAQKTQYDRSRASSYHMRPSRVLGKVRDGGVASVFKLNSACPRIVEMVAAAGLDAIWLGNEHVPSNFVDLENQVRAAKLYDVDVVVRVARGSYSDYIKGFEIDASGIMVPHVMGLNDARNVVRMTKFMPLGRRACDGGNADGKYCRINFVEYLETSNRERFVIYQIEDPEPVAELEAIAELPGVDMLFFGPGDYSHAIGHPGEMNHPEIAALRRKLAKVARDAGKMAGTVGAASNLQELVDMGYNFINAASDVGVLIAGADAVAAAFDSLRV
jgi:4-hydroxy-2-oxoheptanedioate aldolase